MPSEWGALNNENSFIQLTSIPDCDSSTYPGCVSTAETVSPWKHTGDPEIVDRSSGYEWKNPKIGA